MAHSSASRRFLPLIVLLFAGSGCAALIYEIVWFEMLQLLIGSTAVSLGVLLATFMGGMCLGSLALPRVVSARRHPLRVYAVVELGIGVCGIAVLVAMPLADRFYAASAGPGSAGLLLRGMVCAVLLLPPTLLMGASLPAIARWIQTTPETTPEAVSWLGFFYGGNIAGAVCGSLVAGFYLLRVYDVVTATWAAAAVNAAVAGVALSLASRTPYQATASNPASESATGSWAVYCAIAISGLTALGAEVIWTRLLSLMLGATVYTFSLILAGFLMGLGIGSSAGSWMARRSARPRFELGVCQALLAAATAWAAFMLARSLPYWRANPANPWLRFGIDFARALCAVLPAAYLWGASFPLALAAVARRGQDAGRLVGRVYAANTVGAIVGALAFSLLLIPGVGTQGSERVLVGMATASALLALAPFLRRARGMATMAAAVALSVLLAWNLPAVPWGVVAYGRQLLTKIFVGNLLYMGEGMNSSIVISELYKTRMFHVSGKVEASSEPQDMRLERMLGHIPALVHPAPRSVLVVGCGAGVTAGSFVVHPSVERIVICEIEPLIPPSAARYFGRENYNVVRDRRTRVVYDDARHYVLTSRDSFDIITSDPIHPWVKGSATLYTREYFEMCKRHLNPGGLITQWVPLYESTLEAVKSEIATFFEVFPNGTIWGNDTAFGEGYDIVLLGQEGAAPIDVDRLQQRLDRPDHAAVAQSIREVGFASAVSLMATYAGQGSDLKRWLARAQINRDRNLRLQYLAGMEPESKGAYFIYEEMLKYRKFPERLFIASDERKRELRKALQ